MKLSELSPAKGSIKKRKRIGRGQGSGRGGTSTKGHKGAQSRSGYKTKVGFEGGQMPLYKRIPKFGFKNPNRKEYQIIKVKDLVLLAEKYNTTVLDADFFTKHGRIRKNELYKILLVGTIEIPLEVYAHSFSKTAKDAIEKVGGKAITF